MMQAAAIPPCRRSTRTWKVLRVGPSDRMQVSCLRSTNREATAPFLIDWKHLRVFQRNHLLFQTVKLKDVYLLRYLNKMEQEQFLLRKLLRNGNRHSTNHCRVWTPLLSILIKFRRLHSLTPHNLPVVGGKTVVVLRIRTWLLKCLSTSLSWCIVQENECFSLITHLFSKCRDWGIKPLLLCYLQPNIKT